MSSRQEEKERRKQEREAREAAAAAKAKRTRLLQIVGGVVVACAVAAGVGVAVSNGGGGGGDGDVDDAQLRTAARAAGCVYRAFPSEGREHVTEERTEADYKTNPPTSGPHNPTPAPDGLYAPGNEPRIANWVHTLEHGRVLFQYRPGTDQQTVTQLENLFNEDVEGSGDAYHSVLMRNNSKMPFQVAAVSWQHYMGCREFTPQAINALRKFRQGRIDKAPEIVP
jgi:Protein of unknown function (DUF3105)